MGIQIVPAFLRPAAPMLRLNPLERVMGIQMQSFHHNEHLKSSSLNPLERVMGIQIMRITTSLDIADFSLNPLERVMGIQIETPASNVVPVLSDERLNPLERVMGIQIQKKRSFARFMTVSIPSNGSWVFR